MDTSMTSTLIRRGTGTTTATTSTPTPASPRVPGIATNTPMRRRTIHLPISPICTIGTITDPLVEKRRR